MLELAIGVVEGVAGVMLAKLASFLYRRGLPPIVFVSTGLGNALEEVVSGEMESGTDSEAKHSVEQLDADDLAQRGVT